MPNLRQKPPKPTADNNTSVFTSKDYDYDAIENDAKQG